MTLICAHPDCQSRLMKSNTTGVCQRHLHHTRYCQCERCRIHRAKPAPVEREGVRIAEVTLPTAGCSTASAARHKISLPKEPWS